MQAFINPDVSYRGHQCFICFGQYRDPFISVQCRGVIEVGINNYLFYTGLLKFAEPNVLPVALVSLYSYIACPVYYELGVL